MSATTPPPGPTPPPQHTNQPQGTTPPPAGNPYGTNPGRRSIRPGTVLRITGMFLLGSFLATLGFIGCRASQPRDNNEDTVPAREPVGNTLLLPRAEKAELTRSESAAPKTLEEHVEALVAANGGGATDIASVGGTRVTVSTARHSAPDLGSLA